MNSNINNILIGCLLGDAHIGKCGDDKAFITFEQTIKHKDYMIFLYKNLKDNGINLYDIKYYLSIIKIINYQLFKQKFLGARWNLKMIKYYLNMIKTLFISYSNRNPCVFQERPGI